MIGVNHPLVTFFNNTRACAAKPMVCALCTCVYDICACVVRLKLIKSILKTNSGVTKVTMISCTTPVST